MSDKTFKELQVGDPLLKKGRRIGDFQEWLQLTVEKVSPAFYWVQGKKYRKDQNGIQFSTNFYIPGQGDTPLIPSDTQEYEKHLEFDKLLRTVNFIGRTGIESIKDKKTAEKLAHELKNLLQRIDDAKDNQ